MSSGAREAAKFSPERLGPKIPGTALKSAVSDVKFFGASLTYLGEAEQVPSPTALAATQQCASLDSSLFESRSYMRWT